MNYIYIYMRVYNQINEYIANKETYTYTHTIYYNITQSNMHANR